jgi:hypothetical protein
LLPFTAGNTDALEMAQPAVRRVEEVEPPDVRQIR